MVITPGLGKECPVSVCQFMTDLDPLATSAGSLCGGLKRALQSRNRVQCGSGLKEPACHGHGPICRLFRTGNPARLHYECRR